MAARSRSRLEAGQVGGCLSGQGNCIYKRGQLRQRSMHAPACLPHCPTSPHLMHSMYAENWQKISFSSTAQLFCRRVLEGGPATLAPLLGQGCEGPSVAAGQELSTACCMML